jgi:hypothetical protein
MKAKRTFSFEPISQKPRWRKTLKSPFMMTFKALALA